MSSSRLTSPTVLREFLRSQGISPKRRLSQNFLIDQNILEKIVAAAEIDAGDLVLEVGPGPGALTQELLARNARVIAVEKDPVLAHALHRLDSDGTKLQVEETDILDWPVEEKLDGPAKLVANIPYHVTTPLLARVVPLRKLFSKIVVLVQLEVARRFTASPGSKLYGSITLFLKFFSQPRLLFTVKRTCFYPIPKVDSAVVLFEPREPPLRENREALFQLVRTAFGERRKMLRTSLGKFYGSERIEQVLVALGVDPKARPETLNLEQFLELYRRLSR